MSKDMEGTNTSNDIMDESNIIQILTKQTEQLRYLRRDIESLRETLAYHKEVGEKELEALRKEVDMLKDESSQLRGALRIITWIGGPVLPLLFAAIGYLAVHMGGK